MNTPRVVMQETKKAFRAIDKRKDIEAAVSALSNLKGVGPAMASGTLKAEGGARNVKWEKIFLFFTEFVLLYWLSSSPVQHSHQTQSPVSTLTISVRYFLSRGGNSIRNWPTWSGSTPPGPSRQSQGRPSESFLTWRRPSPRSVGSKELAPLLHQVESWAWCHQLSRL